MVTAMHMETAFDTCLHTPGLEVSEWRSQSRVTVDKVSFVNNETEGVQESQFAAELNRALMLTAENCELPGQMSTVIGPGHALHIRTAALITWKRRRGQLTPPSQDSETLC